MAALKSDHPTGRELRLVNAAVSLLSLVDRGSVPPGVVLSDPILNHLDDLHGTVTAYKRHMLKPRMKRHTLIPLRIVP